jgi:hypothetical protein
MRGSVSRLQTNEGRTVEVRPPRLLRLPTAANDNRPSLKAALIMAARLGVLVALAVATLLMMVVER